MWIQNKLCLLISRHNLCNHFQVTFHHMFCYLLPNNCEYSLLSLEQPSLIFHWKNLHSKCWQTKYASLKNFTGQLKSKVCQPDSSMYNSAVKSREVWKTDNESWWERTEPLMVLMSDREQHQTLEVGWSPWSVSLELGWAASAHSRRHCPEPPLPSSQQQWLCTFQR